jgi:hypothetical protein
MSAAAVRSHSSTWWREPDLVVADAARDAGRDELLAASLAGEGGSGRSGGGDGAPRWRQDVDADGRMLGELSLIRLLGRIQYNSF